ncbi:MAG: TonB-dependent receptor [Bacteroidetes bacterium]|nr:TonB-dependent receptor [Bacteroidota bacterium]
MKNYFQKLFFLIAVLMVFPLAGLTQNRINGFVFDKETNQPLGAANILVKGTQTGSISKSNGFFELDIQEIKTVTLLISFVGYKSIELMVEPNTRNLQIYMMPTYIMGMEVVVSASRIDENIRKAPLTIQKINERQIQNSPSGDYFQDMANMRNVEVINNSMGYKIFNSRGFNTTAPLRVVQFIDGVDNQLPTINIVPGNMFGVSDIDIKNIEVISGPASALYGPNAMQGVISYTTKDPYDYPGVAVKVKGGNREYYQLQFRAAETFFNNKLGVKITGSYMSAKDWRADDPVANLYGHQIAPPPLQQKIIGSILAKPEYADFNNYVSNNPNAKIGNIMMMPGYMEKELYNGYIDNMKLSGALYYRFSKDIQARYVYRYSTGTSLYMGNNRAPLDGFYQQLHSLEFQAKGFTLKAYRSNDNTKNTYTLVGAGVNLGFASLPGVDNAFVPAYVNSIYNLSNQYTTPVTENDVNTAMQAGMISANGKWLKPGDPDWDATYDKIKNDTPPYGAHFSSRTTLYHIDGMYEYSFEIVDLNVGASYRNMHPVSEGTVYCDTLQQDGTYRKVSVSEYGGFAQAIFKLLDDNLKLYGSLRADKSENYDIQLSPRLAVIYSLNNHTFRITGQSAFRSPALTDQYQYLNKGSEIVVGNVDGFGNCYTKSSVSAYQQAFDSTLLKTTFIQAIKPEQVKSIEFGYNSTFFDKLYVDFSVYYSRYSDFIGYIRVIRPNTGIAGEQSGIDAIKSRNYTQFNVATNTDQDIDAYGAGISLGYYINDNIKAYFNYTYTNIDSAGIKDDIIPGFNTPKHKFNIGITGSNVYKNLGFAVNFKWVDDYYWQSVFASGPVPSYNTLDLQLSYGFPKLYSTFRIGGSNILNNDYIQAYAMPQIGAFYYASWTFNFDFKK